jgi:soluble lytic murein transglycosylase
VRLAGCVALLVGLIALPTIAQAETRAGEKAREAVARFAQEPASAIAALTAAIEAEPLIASALRTLLAEAHLAAGDHASARREAEAVMATDPRWAHRAAYAAARAALPTDCKAAIVRLDAAQVDPPWVQEAPRLALLSAAHARCGDKATAADLDRALATRHPETSEGEAAAKRVVLTVEDRLARAAGFEQARDYPAALALLTELSGTEAGDTARFRLATLHLDRLRDDFPRAEALFATVAAGKSPHAEEAAYLRAKTRGRTGDVPGALAGYADYLRRFPRGAWADDARFFSAFLLYENGRHAEAARAFAPLAAAGKWARSAEWYRAWCLFLAGENAAAVPLLDRIAARAPDSDDGRQAAYWAARALETRAPIDAAARRRRLVEVRPHDWYGLMIRRRHPGEHAPVPAMPAPPPAAEVEMPPAFVAAAVEIRALAAAGLTDFARRALAILSVELRKADAWDAEAALAAVVDDPERVYRATVTRHRLVVQAPPQVADADIWRRAHPRAWTEAVEAAVKGTPIDPPLVWSFIRKESAFDPDAVSPAHAVGLMQLLPRTARAILDARGQADQPLPDLFVPATNIDLGAWYLDALRARFGGQLPLIAAAYNAGPTSVLSWFGGRDRVETDLFVDMIPFRETREYVKRLVAHRVGYGFVHGGRDLDAASTVLPVSLDLTRRPGVEF